MTLRTRTLIKWSSSAHLSSSFYHKTLSFSDKPCPQDGMHLTEYCSTFRNLITKTPSTGQDRTDPAASTGPRLSRVQRGVPFTYTIAHSPHNLLHLQPPSIHLNGHGLDQISNFNDGRHDLHPGCIPSRCFRSTYTCRERRERRHREDLNFTHEHYIFKFSLPFPPEFGKLDDLTRACRVYARR